MKKSEQTEINNRVLEAIDNFNKYATNNYVTDVKRLRSCSATVYKCGKYFVLRSYNTLIAIIDTETDTLYDFLRYVYGYTHTSAQHISKFERDYGGDKWGCSKRYTYYHV